MTAPTVLDDGWARYNIWSHSQTVRDLYTRRAKDIETEMTCAAQAAEILSSIASPGDSVLDVGCGSGYFFHSLRRRNIPLSYYGIDATTEFIDIGRRELARFGCEAERLEAIRIEDFRGEVDHVVCMNTLSNLDNFHRPLERILEAARVSVVLRESISDDPCYTYVKDEFLDEGVSLKVHVNVYDRSEMVRFIREYGFSVEEIVDERTRGEPEMVIGYPHHWTFMVAKRV